MRVLDKIFGSSPFNQLHEHAKKVHECVELIRPLADAMLTEDYDKIEQLHNLMSRTEHEADQIKTKLRDKISNMYFLSVDKDELSKFLAYQDDVADAAEDFAVVLSLRKTVVPQELQSDFLNFIGGVINVSELLLGLSEKLSVVAEAAFGGQEAQDMLQVIDKIGEDEWETDRLARKFAKHIYSIENKLDPITIMFLDKYCKTLSLVANNAEKTAKHLRLLIRRK